ncbi:MAG: glycosyl hydrolase [Bacteroidales bacterium]|nr:glycosyl hydrolase [Bacteroidales bacterium]
MVPLRRFFALIFISLIIALPFNLQAQKKPQSTMKDTIKSGDFGGLKFRSIGPAYCSGRIADFAVNPGNNAEYFVAVASGHIWKTTNAGTTWEPVFDNYGAYSIGCLKLDPENPNVIWAGTGENNHQRALGYGDGIYKSTDGGKSWKNMGLKNSRQIGMIAIDPRNTSVVYVAAEGSVWGPGGERGLYKTTDGGKAWNKVLNISENTGVNNVIIDPRNPDVLYATSEQRRRHVFSKIGGGPESGIWKSTDAGANWEKLTSGLPGGDMGGIGIAISPVNPDYVFAIIEAAGESGGFFRTTDRGASWSKMSGHTAQGQYYNEIYCDPKDIDKVYSVETFSQFTEDGGKTWKNVSTKHRHVDDHAMWIDPANTKHYLIGGDGGIYETWDGGNDFHFKNNLPVTQFYRVNVDNSEPFYYVYGGTQDNSSMGGPSRNTSDYGVVNDEWFVTNGGDGFWTAVDPVDPNIVYAEAQYGNMVRYDRKSGEAIDIRPEPRKGEDTYKWYWNTPLFISPHANTRLYVAANKVFRSDDRGNTWQVISEDLTTGTDRNNWPVMDKYWSIDAVAKDVSTSLFGLIVSLDESPVKENLLYAGTDDGLIQISEDAKTWSRAGKFPGVPEYTFVSDILASRFDENVVFAAFDNIKRDDFKPYLLKSSDKGKTWVSIASNLPENGTVHTIVQDHVNPDLLFVGTEFGAFFSIDGGGQWTQLKNGLPTIAVRDIVIQQRENDLVLATFGRGFYILENYSPLRTISKAILDSPAHLFDIKDALMFVETGGKYGQGSSYYAAKNPDFGATFSWWLKEVPKTLREQRQEKEKELFKKGEKIPQPTEAELRAEENEIAPYLIFTITDEAGSNVRRLYSKPSKGLNRIVWDLRYMGTSPVRTPGDKFDPFREGNSGLFVMPGKYKVAMSMFAGGEVKELAGQVPFNAVVLNNTTLPAGDRAALVAFQQQVAELIRKVQGTDNFAEELLEKLVTMQQAVHQTPGASPELEGLIYALKLKVDEILFAFNGKDPKASREENPPAQVSINERLGNIIYAFYGSTSAPTSTHRRSYEIIRDEFPPLYTQLKQISETDVPAIEAEMEKAGVPYTPGRLPNWE